MPHTNPDDALLLIRCPSCGQRFKVKEDLRGRTVECGSCEHRFRINSDVIVRGKKFYPGEHKDARLYRFQRVPLAVAPPVMGAQTVRYADPPDPSVYEPVAPQRVLAGLAGVVLMILMGLLLMLGGNPGGALDGMVTANRLLMAAFTGVLGTAMLLYANPRARAKAGAVGLLLSAALVSLPFFFTAGSKPLQAVEGREKSPFEELTAAPAAGKAAAGDVEDPQLAELRERIGTTPLDEEIRRLAAAGDQLRAVGLWLRDMREHNRFLIRDYLLRTTGADPQSHYYPRGNGDYLMVVTGIRMSVQEMAEIVSALGKVEHVFNELSVIEVTVNNDNFVEGPIDKLTDRNNPSFYDLNKRELESIDLGRVERAVKRLAEVPPKLYRADITRKLLALLRVREVNFKGDICRALSVWSETPGPAGEAALEQAQAMLAASVSVPEEMIRLVIQEKNPDVLPVIDALWRQSPNTWEALYGELGPAAEATLLRQFPEATGFHRHSLVRLLGRVGGSDSLSVLKDALSEADSELRVLITKAMESIQSRSR